MSTFAELKTELASSGFDHLSAARRGVLINLAYQVDVAEQLEYEWLKDVTTGTMPLTIATLRTIESVVNTTTGRKLVPRDRRQLTDQDPALDDTGGAWAYFMSSQTEISVWPADTSSTFQVRFWKVPTALSADADVPVLPDRYHPAISFYAKAYAAEENGQPDVAEGARAAGDRIVGVMANVSVDPQADGASFFIPLQGSDS